MPFTNVNESGSTRFPTNQTQNSGNFTPLNQAGAETWADSVVTWASANVRWDGNVSNWAFNNQS